jgi:flagellar biosynthetic protein FlhB
MVMAENAGERSEEATQSRRDEFRNRGQVAHTRELGSALYLLFAFFSVYIVGRFFFAQVSELFERSFGDDLLKVVATSDFKYLLQFAGSKILLMLAPVFLIFLILGILSSIIQVGILTVEDALSPKFEKIDPIQGLQRLFSLKSVVEGIKAILKVSLISFVAYLALKNQVAKFPELIHYSIEVLLEFMGSIVGKLLGSVATVMVLLAAADYFYQRWDLEKQMRMTKQEVKEEHKSREGDPLIKSRVRRAQRDIANRRMMEKVPKADVIITNPTHIAVALKYGADMAAPQLIAKGADLIAEKIKAVAKENNIPVIENKPLARTIYKTLKLGQLIPRELFVAVAEVLSYVYKLKSKRRL